MRNRWEMVAAGGLSLGLMGVALAAYWVALPACAALPVVGRFFPDACPEPQPTTVAAAVVEQDAERAALEAEVARLERELARAEILCVAELPEPEPEIETAEVEVRDIPETIDEERWEERDVGLLEGCWNLDSDYELRDVDTNVTITVPAWEMCFDENGRGSQEMDLSTGETCEAPVNARFDDQGRLVIRDGDQVDCQGGRYIYEREITCELEPGGAQADCNSRQERTGSDVSVTFRR